ncbi:hypothetical protein BDN71DRAFT_1446417 [Pleurotus eryngii]|uniref:Uncharacterized protein n=1 Tax=Pleurotus eryngii TaxID=5323 RepID=A0A9P6A0Y4_PLEER|nr:hypothetical protein BDN71DRAFT_1446417 [Pleurotus eryngii]
MRGGATKLNRLDPGSNEGSSHRMGRYCLANLAQRPPYECDAIPLCHRGDSLRGASEGMRVRAFTFAAETLAGNERGDREGERKSD